ncbi:GNAT family N-acetyltransferase [Ferdinandcohnia quinoae]|uniref:GNAT family N-acetyltransferase n=1 Tax=Fredinandcohnia quinoae TaxID=2918902 RepID=A0AAW5E384_9BACI|nr:GNAT family N-acetyltransferase [Fredinandcohnia sp. SECRCQ15]MCH1624552.1 GNAT family N-acetyltransferase [Fredinandcohnia sp. SECRCQ15]
MEIREYRSSDEKGWVRCRVLSFLDTAYFDNVLREKERYENPSIELVAVSEGQIIGLLDIEYEIEEGTVCSRGTGFGGMIWHIAVHPDFRRRGIGKLLLKKAEQIAREKQLNRLEAWTRDDKWVNNWYENSRFLKVDSYLHVYLDGGKEHNEHIQSEVPNLFPIHTFAHYVGEDKENIKRKFKRVHECVCYEKILN